MALAAGRKPDDNQWCFKGYSLTGPSVAEMIRLNGFSQQSVIFEDFAKDNFASFSGESRGRACISGVNFKCYTSVGGKCSVSVVLRLKWRQRGDTAGANH